MNPESGGHPAERAASHEMAMGELTLLRTTHLIPLSNTYAAIDPLMIPLVAESARQTRARQGNAWENRLSS